MFWTWIGLILTLMGSSCAERTIVMFFAETEVGQSMFIRGGISHTQRPGCVDDAQTSLCAIPINHMIVPADTASQYYSWSQGDNYLDWYGPEVGQGSWTGNPAHGTPLMWTESTLTGPTVENDGYGYTPFNRFGEGYWMLDVDMDCSATENGWFEFKGYYYPLDVWETDRSQFDKCAGVPNIALPYSEPNHFARCGKLNVFYLGEDECNVYEMPLTDPPAAPPAGCGQRKMFDIPASSASVTSDTNQDAGQMIVNGDPAVVGRWPWQGILQYGLVIGGCAATLYDSVTALTAGHCVRGTDPASLYVRFGEQNLYVDQNNEQVIGVLDIIPHPLYDTGVGVEGDNDIAILPLARAVDTSSFVVNPACKPIGAGLDGLNDFVGLSTCWGTGFGDTQGTGEDFRLNEINVPVWTHADCLARYGTTYISERQVCMGTDTLSACGGDSGGPLICYKNDAWVIVGLTSWGEDFCQNGPGVYTRVSEFTDWIANP